MENGELAGDLLDGVKEIAAFTGWSERRILLLGGKGSASPFQDGR